MDCKRMLRYCSELDAHNDREWFHANHKEYELAKEDFHTLRGHKLSMVFQDPLSALNPIMRIGKQLTEAMILNNKERQADGKRCFKSMLSELKKKMVKVQVSQIFCNRSYF